MRYFLIWILNMFETILTKTPNEDVVKIFREANKDLTNKLKENYILHNIINDTIAYSITKYKGNPICISTIMDRPIYNGGVRCLSRYYVSRSMANIGMQPDISYSDGIRLYAVEHLDQQVEFSEKYGITSQFISHENNKDFIIKRIYKGIMIHSKYKDWILEPEKKLVWEGCWQWIIRRGDNIFND